MNTFSACWSKEVAIHVVDDDHGVRESMRRQLRRAGYNVQVHSGAAAFLSAYSGDPGCVILDLAMPNMRGEVLLDEISRRRLNVVVLIVTGHATIESTIRVIRAGALDLLEKPFDD